MPKSLDRLSPALVSNDLTVYWRGRGDADYVGALGMAGRHYPIASSLIRMYLTHDRGSVIEAKRRSYDIARRLAGRMGYRFKMRELVEIASFALEYAVNKTCPRCHGTKFELIPGTNCLGTTPCKECDGDGRAKLPKRNRKLIASVVSEIERIESNLDAIVATRV